VLSQGRQRQAASGIFSKKLNPVHRKYSAYDRELLVVYESVKHFHHMLEASHLIIFTDHKPITYAFRQKRNRFSLRQFNNHFYFVAHFSSGQDNDADALSGVEPVTAPPSHDALASLQVSDDELRRLLASITALRLEKQQICGTRSPTATLQPGKLGRTFKLPYGSKWSSSSRICRTQAPNQQRGWSHSVSCGQTYRRVDAIGFGFARSASAPKSPATQLLEWDTSRCRQPVSLTST
jgi:hypothetical protein